MTGIMLRRIAWVAVMATVGAAVITVGAFGYARKGQKAPAFTLTDISGNSITLSEIGNYSAGKGGGKVVVLDFWATWCPPCREEVPELQAIHEKFNSKDVVVVGISLDDGGAKDVKSFMKGKNLTYTMLTDPDRSAASRYSVRAMPTTFVLDRKGMIRYTHVGFYPGMEKTLESEIKSLL